MGAVNEISKVSMGCSMLLYKFVPTLDIAKQVSLGVFRFYELIKYVKLEKDEVGRSDPAEGSISFPDDGTLSFIQKLPTASFRGVEFQCQSFRPSEEYLRQYFAFSMSVAKSERAIGDCKYAVELSTDVFEVLDEFLHEHYGFAPSGSKRMFSHGAVEYYDIDRHPLPFGDNRWREVYVKHSSFAHQEEYRAALFVSDAFVDRIRATPKVVEREILQAGGEPFPFELKFVLRSGIDEAGWRYIEIDVSEFQANLIGEPSKIVLVG